VMTGDGDRSRLAGTVSDTVGAMSFLPMDESGKINCAIHSAAAGQWYLKRLDH
jgi:hypothetical protein